MSEASRSSDEAAATGTPTSSIEGQGLLDLSIELSSPQVFSGSRFALYLHVKNPYSRPIWVRKVTTHLPSAVYAVEPRQGNDQESESSEKDDPALVSYTRTILERLTHLQQRSQELDRLPRTDKNQQESQDLAQRAGALRQELKAVHDVATVTGHYDSVVTHGESSSVSVQGRRSRPLSLTAHGDHSSISFEQTASSQDTVALHGSLPEGMALQPGSHNVWTLTLATNKNPFFLPAAYRFNITVLYSFEPPEAGGRAAYSSTAPTTVNIRSSLWSVMGGSVTGGVLGTVARILQQAQSVPPIVSFATLGPLLLSATLSIAASIFAARKSETQSFISVEDFWGGALVGFLIGYSGTAAFENLTRVQSEPV